MKWFDFSKTARVASPPTPPRVRAPADATLLSDEDADDVAWQDAASLDRGGHVLVAAATQGGKTTMVERAKVLRMGRGVDTRFISMDIKQSLEVGLPMAALYNPASLASTAYINLLAGPGSPGRVQLNLAKADYGTTPRRLVAQSLAHIISKTAAGEGQSSSAYRIHAVLVALLWAVLEAEHPQRSILWCADALTVPQGINQLAALVPNEEARAELLSVATAPPDARAAALARLRVLTAGWPSLTAQLGAPGCTDFQRIAREYSTYVDCTTAPPGGEQTMLTFSNLLLEQFASALLRRDRPRPRPVVTNLVIDECLQFAPILSTTVRAVLERGRSFGAEITLCTQHLRGLRDLGTVWDSTTANASWIAGALNADDCIALAREKFGSANDPRAVALSRRLRALQPREFCISTPDRLQFFRSATVDFRALEAASRAHEAQFKEVMWRFNPGQLPEPTRLWHVGGPRADVPAASSSVMPTTPRRRPRSILG